MSQRAETRLRKRMLVGLGAMLTITAAIGATALVKGWPTMLFGYSMQVSIFAGGIMLARYITKAIERTDRRTRQKIVDGFERLREVFAIPERERDWDSTFAEIRRRFDD